MLLYLFIIIMALASPIIAAFFISSMVFKKLVKAGLKSARLYMVLTFIFSFAVIFGGIVILALFNIRIER